jgi:hypothetical protein
MRYWHAWQSRSAGKGLLQIYLLDLQGRPQYATLHASCRCRISWLLLGIWLVVMVLSPVWTYPLPWATFAPNRSAFQGMDLMRIPSFR